MYGNVNRFKDVDEIGEYMSTLKNRPKEIGIGAAI